MRELHADELHLRGRLQVETAIEALAYTGLNPAAQNMLQIFLDAHTALSDGESQSDLSFYIRGGNTEQEKTDIVMSLDVMKDSDHVVSEAKIAADALRQIL